MTFVEALEFAFSRKIILPHDYYNKITDRERHSATSIAGLAKLEQVDYIITQAHKSILDGSTFAEFAKKIDKADIDIKLSEARLKLIFRTNVQTAYNHGKWQQQVRNKKYRPYLIYHAVKDNRTRDDHYSLNGVIKHIDDPFWTIYYPLNGYNCRCSVRSLTEKQAKKLGGETLFTPDIDMSDGFKTGPMYHDKTLQSLVDKYKTDVPINPNAKGIMEDVKNDILSKGENATIKAKYDAINSWLDKEKKGKLRGQYDNEYSKISQKYDLDFDDFAVLKGYVDNYDNKFNSFLAGNFTKVDDATAKSYMLVRSLINESAAKLPAYDGTVTKGMTLTSEQISEYKVGKELTINSFFSVSKESVNISSKNNVLLTIKCKNGRIISDLSDSEEILLLSPSKFIITSKTKVGDKVQIILSEI